MPAHAIALASEPPLVARIGRYAVLRRLGLGKNSEVLLASARGPWEFERLVAVKRLLPGAVVDEMSQRRFAREAVAYARLDHPAIVRLYDVIAEPGELALVLEHVDGIALAQLLADLRARGERLADDAAAWIGTRIFAALAAAHDARHPRTGERAPVIHRDVTPANVLVPWDGFAKLADFGIAKVTDLAGDTRRGVMKGTYGYMAPEQVVGDPVTVATDVYQACLVLHELFAGHPAIARAPLAEMNLLRAMAEGHVPPIELSRPDLPAEIVRALRRGLAHDARERTISPSDVVELLRLQFDVERGRALLAGALHPSRPHPESGCVETAPTPRRSVHPWMLEHAVPPAMRVPRPPPIPFDLDAPRARARSRLAPVLFAAGALAFVLAFVAMRLSRKAPSPSVPPPPPPAPAALAEQPRPAATPPPPLPPPVPTPSATPSAKRAETPPRPGMGLVTTPASAAGHRVFVDGRLACAGATRCEVRCGRRVVRIGSEGRAQKVDVPCGDAIAIDR